MIPNVTNNFVRAAHSWTPISTCESKYMYHPLEVLYSVHSPKDLHICTVDSSQLRGVLLCRVGDVITHVERVEGGWWRGRLRGEVGMFPDNFVKVGHTHQSQATSGYPGLWIRIRQFSQCGSGSSCFLNANPDQDTALKNCKKQPYVVLSLVEKT